MLPKTRINVLIAHVRRHWPLLLCIAVIAGLGYALRAPLHDNMSFIRHQVIHFRSYCRSHTELSWGVFSCILGISIITGLPFTTFWMLSAGLFYGFWEAVILITLTRLLTAVVSFIVARRIMKEPEETPRKTLSMLRRLEHYPAVGLFLFRLAPIPDGIVNYTSAAMPISHRDYLLASILGMIPFTLFCVWFGQHLGGVTRLMHLL